MTAKELLKEIERTESGKCVSRVNLDSYTRDEKFMIFDKLCEIAQQSMDRFDAEYDSK